MMLHNYYIIIITIITSAALKEAACYKYKFTWVFPHPSPLTANAIGCNMEYLLFFVLFKAN